MKTFGTFAFLLAALTASLAATFSDDFSSGLSPAFWTITQTTSNLYSVNATGGNVTFAKAGANPGGLQNVTASLNLAALGGSISGDFSAQIDFTNAVIGPNVDQVELHAYFADSSYFFDVYDLSGGRNVHVWNGSLNGATSETVTYGTFKISRTGTTLTGYFNGALLFSESDSAALTGISFVLQNQPGSDDYPSVTFDNFSLTAASVSADQAPSYLNIVTNTPNLLGYWRFDPIFQTNSVVNGYTGTLQGNAQIGLPGSGCPLLADPANQGLLLDGVNSYLATSLTGQITNQGTVLVWVFLTAQPSTAGHIFQITSQAASGNDFDFQIQTDNHTYFFTDSGGSTVYPQPLPLNQWHFMAATFIANSTRCIYLDGQLVASSSAGAHAVNNTAFWIGNNRVFGPRLFQGRLDEVALFNRALTASEIAAVYSSAIAPRLSITPQNNNVVLTWPTNYPGFALQTNAVLNLQNWGTLATSYGINFTNYAFTNAIGSSTMFYRLMK